MGARLLAGSSLELLLGDVMLALATGATLGAVLVMASTRRFIREAAHRMDEGEFLARVATWLGACDAAAIAAGMPRAPAGRPISRL